MLPLTEVYRTLVFSEAACVSVGVVVIVDSIIWPDSPTTAQKVTVSRERNRGSNLKEYLLNYDLEYIQTETCHIHTVHPQ